MVDDFARAEKKSNLVGLETCKLIDRNDLFNWLEEKEPTIDFVFHLGARTDTTQKNKEVFDRLNFQYSQDIWMYCSLEEVPLIYASSAATYGLGELGFEDSHDIVDDLKPLNPYGDSKNNFDKWALKEFAEPPFWAGFKFFNVFGPNEYHKGRMASVVFHFYHQIISTSKVNLFKSHKEDYADGEQTRDFIYINDLLSVLNHFHEGYENIKSGIYNLGTGKSRTYNDLAKSIFDALGKGVDINYVDTPEDIRDTYQYYTEANMAKLRSIGYKSEFMSLENAVKDYVNNYLSKDNKNYSSEKK